MKTIATLIFVLFITVSLQAQTANETLNMAKIEKTLTLDSSKEEVSLKSTLEVVRLYKRIDTRVKKALTFVVNGNGTKKA